MRTRRATRAPRRPGIGAAGEPARSKRAPVVLGVTAALLSGLLVAAPPSLAAIHAPDPAQSAAVAAAAKGKRPAVAVSRTTVKRGETFAVAGRHFEKKLRYRIRLAAKRVAVGRVTARGTVLRTVTFPATAPLGRQRVTLVTYRNGQRFQKATVFVTVVRSAS